MGLLDGVFSTLFGDGPGGNPNAEFKGIGDMYHNEAKGFYNPNSQWYKTAGNAFARQLSASSPTLNSMIGFAMNQGNSNGGSFAIGDQQRKAMEARNRESTANFQGNLLQTGSNIGLNLDKLGMDAYGVYGEGNSQAYNAKNSYKNSMLSGLLGFAGNGGFNAIPGMVSKGFNAIFGKSAPLPTPDPYVNYGGMSAKDVRPNWSF